MRAIFFDFGGTIVTEESDRLAHYHISEFIKEKYRIPLNHEEIDRLLTEDLLKEMEFADKKWPPVAEILKRSFEKLLLSYEITPSPEEKDKFVRIYYDFHVEYMEPFSDAIPTLENLKRNFDGHIGIISDIVDYLIHGILKKYDLYRFFDSITTSEAVGVGKPNPKIFHQAFKKAGVGAGESIYIGNSPKHDVIGAKNVGMKVILVGPKEHHLADFKVRNLSEILPIIFDGRL